MPKKKTGATDTLALLVGWVDDAETASADARSNSERDRDYYDGIQLTSSELAELARRGQPPIVINRIKRKVAFLTGLEKQQRTDPRGFARNPEQDEEAADAATDSIRFVLDNNDFDVTRSKVWENLLIEGMGGCEVGVQMKARGAEIFIKRWAWDRIGYDPHSSAPDFSDARYTYGILWMDVDTARHRFPSKEAQSAITATVGMSNADETYDDKPRSWVDNRGSRVKIAQMYYKRGSTWHSAVFTRGGIISGGPVPYLDEDGDNWNPMILASAYVNRDNDRYGAVREMISPSDEINKRRSKLLHQLTMRQTIGEAGAVADVRKAKQELAKPDGHVEVTPNMRFEIVPNNDQIAGQASLLSEAKAEIDLMGPNASLSGKKEGNESGRAILAQQQGGIMEIADLMDTLRQWNKRVYQRVWLLIRQYWTEEKWVRVTDNEDNAKFVAINQPITLMDQLKMDMEAQKVPPRQIEAEIAEFRATDPRAQIQVGVRNKLAELEVDIVIEDAPDTVTIQAEQFDQIVGLAQAGVVFPPEVYIRASQLRNKEELINQLKGGTDPEQVQAAQEQEQAATDAAKQSFQLEMAKKSAEVEKTAAQTSQIKADAMKKVTETAALATGRQA